MNLEQQTMLQILEVSVALLFFSNKVFVLIGKRTGWLLGVIAAFLAGFYFYYLELYVYTILEIGLIVLMGYGFLIIKKQPRVERFIHGVIIILMVILSYFVFDGMLTIYEFISSIGMLVGTYFLTHERAMLGWLCYTVGHLLSVYVMYSKDQSFFADFQLASAIVSSVGFISCWNRTRPPA